MIPLSSCKPRRRSYRALAGIVALFTLLGAGADPAEAQARRMDITDLGRIVRVAEPQISPDGRSVVVLVSRPNYDDNRYDASLVVVDVATGAERVLSRDRRGLSSPRWSPRGDQLAFLANARLTSDARDMPQIFVLPMAGGEPWRVTSAPAGVQQFAWRPDGKQFAYTTADEPEKKTGPERFNDAFEIGNNDYLVTAAPTPTHLWLVATEGGAARRLTSGQWSLPTVRPPGSPPSPIAWSPDGRLLGFAKVPTPHSGDFSQSTAQILDVSSGVVRPLTSATRMEGYVLFSPDGSRVAYWYSRDGDQKYGRDAYVVPAAGGTPVNVTGGLDRNIARTIWMPDGRTLLVGANDERRVSLWLQPAAGGVARKLDLGDVSPNSSFWVDASVGVNGAIAFVGTTPTRPAELYYLRTSGDRPRRLTELNTEVAGLALGRTEVVDWTGPDGVRSNGTLTYPVDFDPVRKYPLVLVVHGGPRAATLATFSPQAQLMAARGWVVFQPNYRGSDHAGNVYQGLIDNDAGEGPGRDVIAGIAAVKARGFVDTTRVAVSGWSYGGYMTSWLIGRYPTMWRAAVAGAPVTDWVDQYNLGDGNVARARAFGGSPWTDGRRKAYEEQSPMRYAPDIRTPTLVMHNVGDDRVTVTQGYKLWHALVDNGVPTQFIAYPIAGHNASDPVRQRDVQRRWIGWLAKYLNGAPGEATASQR